MKTITTIISGIIASHCVFSASAEITGSGIRSYDCDGELSLSLWRDVNANGLQDGAEDGIPNAKLIVSLADAPELGVEIFSADSSGLIDVEYLCEGQYRLEPDPDSLPDTLIYSGAYDAESLMEITGSGLLDDGAITIPLGDGDDGNPPDEREINVSFTEIDSDVTAAASCGTSSGVAVGNVDDYQCDKPVSQLSLVWNGGQPVRVVAHAGKLDNPVVADFDHVIPGQVVTVAGLEDSGSDIIYEIYEAGTDTKIGESSFHVSCSDDFMDGPEDCGLAAGDGKNDDKCTDSCMNDWLFAGYIDKHNEIQCLPMGQLSTDASCSVYRDSGYAVRYQVTNESTNSVELGNLTESVSGVAASSIPLVASGQQVELAWFGIANEDVTRSLSVQGGAPGAYEGAVESTAAVTVMELPPACDAVSVELRDLSHDKFKLRFTNEGDRALGLIQYELIWPQENEVLVEVKWDGDKIVEQDSVWQPLTVHGVDDFLLDPDKRMIPAEDDVEVEFKFDNHVHNSPQVYEVEFEFDTNCWMAYSITP